MIRMPYGIAHWGSPPLTRGPLVFSKGDPEKIGITPAHAGTTDLLA